MRLSAIALPILIYAGHAHADDGSRCVGIANDIQRLQCFDQAFATTQKPAISSEWIIREEISPIDDKRSIYAHISPTTVSSTFSTRPDAELIIRCAGGETSIFIAGRLHFANVKEVSVRVDSAPADIQTHIWDVSSTGSAIGMWSGKNPVDLIKSLTPGGKFAIRVVGMHLFEAVFDVGKIDPVREKIAELCNWKYIQ